MSISRGVISASASGSGAGAGEPKVKAGRRRRSAVAVNFIIARIRDILLLRINMT